MEVSESDDLYIAEGDSITPHSTLHAPNSVSVVIFQSFGDLHNTAGAQAVGTQFNELFRVLQRGDAAGGLDLHMRGHMSLEQRHIGEGRARFRKTGGGLNIVRSGIGYALAQGDLFLVGEQAGLDDDLQQLSLAGFLDFAERVRLPVRPLGRVRGGW